jgi:hypothetical protein
VAPAIACSWALTYYWCHRHAWDWLKEGGMLMVVSIFAAPYCFFYDQGLVIPGLLQGAYLTKSRTLLVILALSSIVVEGELISAVKIHSAQFLWTAPHGWCDFCLQPGSRRRVRRSLKRPRQLMCRGFNICRTAKHIGPSRDLRLQC